MSPTREPWPRRGGYGAGPARPRRALQSIRPLAIEAPRGPESAGLVPAEVRGGISGRRVLVAGAGGSIGSEVIPQIAGLGPAAPTVRERATTTGWHAMQFAAARIAPDSR
jgi:hypothetical protein